MPNKTRRIKDWEKFQHYQSGVQAANPKWIKLYKKLLDDLEWHNLSGDDAKLLVELWMLASENGGTLPPITTIAFRLRRSEKTISSILSRLPHWVETEGTLEELYTNSIPDKEEDKIENKKENKNKTASREADEISSPLAAILEKEVCREVIEFRKRIKKPLTPLAALRLANQLSKWPDPNEAAAEMVLRGWQGFNPEWMVNAHGPPRKEAHFRSVVAEHLEEVIRGSEQVTGGTNGSGRVIEFRPAAAGHENDAPTPDGNAGRRGSGSLGEDGESEVGSG